MKQTKFSFEVPIKHLKDFEDLQDFNFTLSILYEDERYAAYMKKQLHQGLKPLWLDNSYNELLTSEGVDKMERLAHITQCHKVIAPDDPSWGFEKSLRVYRELCRELPYHKVAFVVINESWSKAARLLGDEVTFCYPFRERVELSYDQLYWSRNCHYLGMNSVEEMTTIKPPSCDTSMPIKLALRGWNLNDWKQKGSPHIYTHEDTNFFYQEMSLAQIMLARENIIALKREVNEI